MTKCDVGSKYCTVTFGTTRVLIPIRQTYRRPTIFGLKTGGGERRVHPTSKIKINPTQDIYLYIKSKTHHNQNISKSMGKKNPVSKSLQGKKPINSAQKIVAKHKNNSRQNDDIHVPKNPGQIGNKLKRSEMYGKYLHQKALVKQEKRRQQQEQQSKDDAVPKNVPKTLDSMREMDITMVRPDDMNEILGDEADDEFSPYFMTPVTTTTRRDVKEDEEEEDDDADDDDVDEEDNDYDNEEDDEVDDLENATTGLDEEEEEDDDEEEEDEDSVNEPLPEGPVPKILITTRPHPSQKIFYFIGDLQNLIPQLYYYPRKQYTLSQITQYAYNRHFTHLIVVSEKNKVCNGMIISHLGYRPPNDDGTPDRPPLVGPTAYFKVSNVVTGSKIPHHGCRTSHRSEMNLHNFHHTRLGHRIGRLFASLFPIQHGPQFEGRQIVTFHNQRDYIFVRHHRYIFQSTDQNSSSNASKSTLTKKNAKEIALDTTTQPTQVSESAARIPVRTKLQELGPRFTLKLRWLQDGIIDENQSANSVYEFIHKRKEMDTSRRKFHL